MRKGVQTALESIFPARFHLRMLALWGLLARHWYAGSARYCPVCNSHLRTFLPHGRARRPDALCPVCFSLERHRAAWVFLQQRTDLWQGAPRRRRHFAPEPAFQIRLAALAHLDYVTADLDNPRAAETVDITRMPFADGSFDGLYCSHVLEHVPADRQAMSELWRVLKPGAWALVLVPVTAERTIEDLSITDPGERLRRYGQADHVRRYGPDVAERLREAGFEVTVLTEAEVVGSNNVHRMAVSEKALLHSCKKPGWEE